MNWSDASGPLPYTFELFLCVAGIVIVACLIIYFSSCRYEWF